MQMIRLYVFLDEQEQIIEQVRAENHDQAILIARNPLIKFDTDFYSTDTTQ